MNVEETATGLRIEVVGMKKDEIEVGLKGRILTISGKEVEARTLALPSTVDLKKISAEYKDDLLILTLPYVDLEKKALPEKISIDVK